MHARIHQQRTIGEGTGLISDGRAELFNQKLIVGGPANQDGGFGLVAP